MPPLLQPPPDPVVAFGPVPSRRLGRSLGIDHLPPKSCTYACVYCQLGPTLAMRATRREFYPPDAVVAAVERRVADLRRRGERIDVLTFVPAGEPTLDRHLGHLIRGLRPLGLPVAVISNASLVWQDEVRADLAEADWVSLKVDTVDPAVWRALDRPHGLLDLDRVLGGIRAFARAFGGTLVTETMLVAGTNDDDAGLAAIADYLAEVAPRTAYLAVPTRPPAVPTVRPPDADAVVRAVQLLRERLPAVECLLGYEGNAFAASGNAEADLLGITAVHPLREDAALDLLARCGADGVVLVRLVDAGELVASDYRGHTYYLRRLRRPDA